MSVLIKDMEIPTSCTMCWLNTFCGVWNIETVKYKGFNKRLDGCPLTELIRCKDCKHRDPEDKKCDCGHSIRWQLPRSDEWFCADAERRGEE